MDLRKKPKERRRHPDPGTELELRRILDLLAANERRIELIRLYRQEIVKFGNTARNVTGKERSQVYIDRADEMGSRIIETEQEIEQAGKTIAELQADIDPSDLAYLW
jgi:hypothetical protein